MEPEHLLDQGRREAREPAPAELDRPRDPDPARRAESAIDDERVAVGEHSLAPPLGVELEQRPHPSAEGGGIGAQDGLLGGKAQFHARAIVEAWEDSWVDQQRASIELSDGTRLATRLWLPDVRPAPVILEALPYRMDDLTASYASEYERLCEEGGFAVARIDVRGTGASTGIPTDEYPPEEQRDLTESIAWLAAQEWSNGRVGMYGTSYSGFNSLQLAAERPPGLEAICAIYATDDRYTDDVHFTGGALRGIDLVDYVLYMAAMNVLPPPPAVFGDRLARRVAAPDRGLRALVAAVAGGAAGRAVLASGIAAARA